MNKFSIIGLTILSFLSGISYSQNNPDVSLLYSKSYYNKLTIEYRKPQSEKLNIKLGLTYGAKSTYPFGQGEIREVSDSSVIMLYTGSENTIGSVKLGVEKQLKSSLFYLGADLFLGYRNSKNYYFDKTSLLGSNGQWESESFLASPSLDFDGQTINHYFVPELQVGIGINVPLGEYFLINLFTSNSLGMNIQFDETKTVDPLNKFSARSNTLDFDINVGLGIRYKIGSKEV